MNAVERGDHSMLGELMLAAPGLGRLPFVTPFLHAVYGALTDAEPPEDGTEETTREPIYAAAEQGSDTQRAAGVARLRRLARREPEQAAALQKLINILAAPTITHRGPAHYRCRRNNDQPVSSRPA